MDIFKKTRWLVAVVAIVAALPAAAQNPPAPGTFLGAVLVSDDAAAASAFYSALFNWDVERAEDGGFAVRHKGRMIAGISPIKKSRSEIEESTWLVGLAVEDVERSFERAVEAGATIYERVERVSDYGRFAVVADRQGAPLLLIEPGVKPLTRTTGHGSWVWAELWTDDPADAAEFYQHVIGVGHDTVDREGTAYHLLTSAGEPRAGVIGIPSELETVKPGWAPYVTVSDIADTLAKAEDLGGRVVFGAAEHPAQGSVALIMDPSGAVLFVYQRADRKGGNP